MRWLVTGGTGFIARHFVPRLLARNDEATLFDRLPSEWDAGAARVVMGDIRDISAVRAAMLGCDAILHLAAAHHDSGIPRSTYFSVNEAGAQVLCEAADAVGIRQVCFFSTVAVYGAATPPLHEGIEPRPESAYGQSKWAAEQVFRTWSERGDGRAVLTVRPTVVFGPWNYANMFTLIQSIDQGRYLNIGPGTNVKSIVFVENVVDATLHLWTRANRPPWSIVNLVDKPDLTSGQIAACICRSLGKRPPRVRLPVRIALAVGLAADAASRATGRSFPISRARIRKYAIDETKFEATELRHQGFRSTVSLEDGLAATVEWYRRDGRASKPLDRRPNDSASKTGGVSE
jgi:nucleoside-diphosphate-sugar epimerase